MDLNQPKGNILVVDDTPENLRLLSQMLALRGYKAISASDGMMALESARSSSPDLILLDVSMPNMDGYEVCRRLKQDLQTRTIPVIFLSALAEVNDKVRAFNAGGVDYITKPFQPLEVFARIENHLAIRNLQVQLEQRLNELEQARQAEYDQRMLTESLWESVSAVNSTLDLDIVFDLLLSRTARVVPFDAANIALLDETCQKIQIKLALGYSRNGEPKERNLTWRNLSDVPIWRSVIQTNRSIYIPDTLSDKNWIPEDRMDWVRSLAVAPVRLEEKVIGLLSVDSKQAGFYTMEHAERLQIFADQTAAAIRKAQLYTEARRRADQLEILNRIGLAITSGLELNKVLDALYEQVSQVMTSDTFYVALYNMELHSLEFPFFKDQGELLPAFRHDILTSGGLTGHIIRNRRTLYLPDTMDPQTESEYQIIRVTDMPTRTYLGVPMVLGDRIIGVISVQSAGVDAYKPEQIRLFETIAAQAAVAIDNARLFDEMQHLATTDFLTGISNRRHFFNLARKEFERARRYNRPLSVVMFDLDHFKRVNDTYGHPLGDEVLRFLARQAQASLRGVDLLGRYGGEEFVALLPETGLLDAMNMAERLRLQMASSFIPTSVGELNVTISLGVADLEIDDNNVEAVVGRADQALYLAKQSGRNKVMLLPDRK